MHADEVYQIGGSDATAVNVVAIAAAEDVALRGYTEERISGSINRGEYIVLHARAVDSARKAPEGTILGNTFIKEVIAEWLKVRGQVSLDPAQIPESCD